MKLPIPEFELLFESGCSALLDGYPREAVTSLACSFERFQEFACRFFLARRNVSFEAVEAWWKKVAKQSERQLGSFVALWIADFRSTPPLLSQKLVQFRNACVHEGRIPPDHKAKEYGEAVLRAEVEGILALRNCFDSELEYDDYVEHHIVRSDTPEHPEQGLHLGFSLIGQTVVSRMWRPNERSNDSTPAEDEQWGFRLQKLTKNPTDPKTLTMDQALRLFRDLSGLGLRRR